MIEFILNDQDISTGEAPGTTVLDFVRYHKNLKGTKIGCREGDCGACTVLVGELASEAVKYRTMTSCLMPLANAAGKHIVTVEGINPNNAGMTPVQQALVDETGTQCGFCTVGFVMSLTGFCIDETAKTPEMAVSAVDGNICRCTGYKSIERAAVGVSQQLAVVGGQGPGEAGAGEAGSLLTSAIEKKMVPKYFAGIGKRLTALHAKANRRLPTADRQLPTANRQLFIGGGTDLYVQKPDTMAEADATALFYDDRLRGISDAGEHIEIGASVTVTDLLVSPVMQQIFPDLYKHLKLVSSTPIRNMATLAGNFVNASPIGDMTVWFLALDAEIELARTVGENASVKRRESDDAGTFIDSHVSTRCVPLRDLYLGYKRLAKSEDEYITTIRFRKPVGDFRFNFEKVSKRTYLDISTVNTAISLRVRTAPADDWMPPALSETKEFTGVSSSSTITDVHVAAGGVAPVPLYLKETCAFLNGKQLNAETIREANEVMQAEVSPISDVRGTEAYKRLLLRQLFTAHFYEMFGLD